MIEKPQFFQTESELPNGAKKIDAIESAMCELFFIENPTIRKDDPNLQQLQDDYRAGRNITGVWVYYPWKNIAVHIPSEDIYYRLRTARNRDLITEEEQLAYRNIKIGIGGLSVGSAVLSTIVLTGGSKTIKIADPDIIEITNLNRIRAKLTDVTENKSHVAAREVWELDPFTDLDVWDKGIEKDTIEKFIGGPKLDIFIDEMDNIEMKIRSRLACRAQKIPVIMATSDGDNIIIDVERHDLQENYPIFHGNVAEEELLNMDQKQFVKMVVKIIDPRYFSERHKKTVLSIGKTLAGAGQLGTAVTIAGAAMAFVVRQIAIKSDLPSGRYVLRCDEAFDPDYHSPTQEEKRWTEAKEFADRFGITIDKPIP